MSDRQRHGFVLLVVVGLIIASVVVITTQRTLLGLDLRGGVQLVYQAEPTPQSPVNQSSLNRAVDIMRQRVDQLGVSEPVIQTSGGNQISVGLPDVRNVARAEQQVGSTARLYFYDWEANVITPNGKSVASQMEAQDPQAVTLSQGLGGGPGVPGAGGVPIYQAVKLASQQPALSSSQVHLSRSGALYYLFGAPGSSACATVARANGTTPIQGQHCLLAGPESDPQSLAADLPAGVGVAAGLKLAIPQGWVILQAANPSSAHPISPNSPSAQFFVLRDDVALTGADVTNPQASTDQGSPDVQFGLNSTGSTEFQNVTARIAHRASVASPIGQAHQNQHFATALGGAGATTQILSVPQIDYSQYPDGITGGGGADITGGFTSQTASDLASQLRLGALPINLRRISENQVSATLGAQALHQGLIAGLAGLAVVALFLLVYYRVLGMIATAALGAYALYFYALIKLIPITLTLPGIAGLILTIGVAADANIVIFERVKEEIRAGRSIRTGIATGYRKGLTAIIDANVVTIMTAFILFVLATAEVQGFAFTLGIGTIVSLFTAVLATQAILMTMGDSRTLARPSALGAAKPKRVWRFDFMGASRYFFSMSGVILLIGALAIGGKGLNLGIDFTSGTRIVASLDRSASESQVRSVVASAGAAGAEVQKLSDRALGSSVFEISSKKLGPDGVPRVRDALQSKFGLRHALDSSSVGPTFGRTIAHSAVIAIIASLLVISAYVALRFTWKFAIPVLIALMHDLLITSGVYALVGREVTVDTVAALLTILGYSLYDTIIVFDRVRENIPRMPRAAFSQIVNRSMSEVLTRSLATTTCTLLPIVALLLFGGSTLRDFAFALLIGVASGAYSSIFIASPVLTHWKEREATYRHRRERIIADHGTVPAYAGAGADVEPQRERLRRRAARITEPEPEGVTPAEFEAMKRDLDIEREPARRTSTLTRRRTQPPQTRPGGDGATRSGGATPRAGDGKQRPGDGKQRAGDGKQRPGDGKQRSRGDERGTPAAPPDETAAPPDETVLSSEDPVVEPEETSTADAGPAPETSAGEDTQPAGGYRPAPDEPENEGVARAHKPARSGKSRSRGRRHGRHR
ncbi:MAG: protein translocase subunit SecD [Solirubrobacterales bacterium]|nr:protein translocase subunit SecD [Solirubrobacterales bacterium]